MKRRAAKPGGKRVPRVKRGVMPSRNAMFLPDLETEVKAIAMRGNTDDEICAMFGIDRKLFDRWKKFYPDFRKAIEEGRTMADGAVVQSLFKEAVGYEYTEQIAAGRAGTIKSVKRFARPNGEMIKFWLKNRDKANWGDRHSLDGGSNKDGIPIPLHGKPATNEELIASILTLVKPKDDNEVT